MLALFSWAIDNYNPKAGTKFSTYLTHCIRNAIKKEANKFYGPLTITSEVRLMLFKVEMLEARGFSKEDIKRLLKLKDKAYKNLQLLKKLVRIESSIEDSFTEIPTALIMEEAGLTPLELQIIEMRQANMSLREVGEKLGYTGEWIRQIEQNCIAKVKAVL
jgi:RNA polymerase sigma factor (sigma-70 family)